MEEQEVRTGLRILPTLLGLGALATIASLLPSFPHVRVAGVKFYFRPRTLQRGFDPRFVERFVSLYAAWVPPTYKSLGYETSTDEIKGHISKIKCEVVDGYLISSSGRKDALGITHSDTSIEVAITENMVEGTRIKIDETALAYEIHNACVWRFAGSSVSRGAKEEQLVKIGPTEDQLKLHKSALDAAFIAVQNEIRG